MQQALSVRLCPRCQRANPAEAAYCHFDGVDLRQGVVGASRGGELGREFVFPSGRRCRTFDDLVRGCSEEWNTAREMLRQGGLRQFMAGLGRMDLAYLAEQAAAAADLDTALDGFLAKLPTREALRPRLDLIPRRLNLGRFTVGETRQYTLKILNQGTGLLLGDLQPDDVPWLSIVGANGVLPVRAGRQQQVTIQIDTFGLAAGQKYSSKLTLITNGGAVEAPVSFEVEAIPFPDPPLQGATSPRELASRMRDAPKQVAPLLEGGAVQRWFAANGWSYPVQGAPAPGVAGVQQFFEGLGLSKPPLITLSQSDVHLVAYRGQIVTGAVTLSTNQRKWLYAHVTSDSSWLIIDNPDCAGPQQVQVEFTADCRELEGDRCYTGRIEIGANGGQRFAVTCHVDVHGGTGGVLSSLLRGAVVGAAFGFFSRLLLSLPDLLYRPGAQFGAWLPDAGAGAHAGYVPIFALMTAWLGIPAGLAVMARHGKARDLPAGLLAGAMTGLAVTVTFASLLVTLDGSLAWIVPGGFAMSAVLGWGIVGAAAGCLLSLLGKWGRRLIDLPGRTLAWVARRLGLHAAAEFLAG